MIIGLVGRNAAGKGTVADYLKEKGFYYFSLSDVLRQEAEKRGLEKTRENLIAIGNELREKFGAQILAEKAIQILEKDRNYVIDSIRSTSEANFLKQQDNFFLFFIDAPFETRFERIKKRNRVGDPKTIEEFREFDEKESKGKENEQQLDATIELANKIIENDSDLEKLKEKIDKAVVELPQTFKRPSWDEYFINVAKTVATRANCVKRKVAAVIVKDKRIVSTGYNGTPRGTTNCNEGGCPRCNAFGKSGTDLGDCLCAHAEENAIVQAAYHGVSVKDSTIYSTFSPCLYCSRMIINAGIKRVVYNVEYPLNESAQKLFKEAGVKLEKFEM